jgi:hypothetical protein
MLGGAALAAVVLIAAIVINQNSGGTVDDGGHDFTAWQSRTEMELVMTETAAAIGLAIEANDPDDLPLSCDLAAGGEGSSLLVTGFDGPALVDIDASLTQVRALWEGRGLVVNDRAINDKKGLSTTLPDGGSFFLLAGPASTAFAGESGCARTVGGPTGTTSDGSTS